MDLESRLLYCMVNLQGLDAGKIKKNAISGKGEYSSDMESLVGFVVSASPGTTMQLPQSNPNERDAYARGKQICYFRAGPSDFCCPSCHSDQDHCILLQHIPDLTPDYHAHPD